MIRSLRYDKHDYLTLGYDTLDWIEPQIHQFVLERDSGRETEMNPKGRKLISIEDYGYGKGYLVAEEEFRKLIGALDELQAHRGMHVVLLMHSQVRAFKNPTGPDFDRYEPKCQARIARVSIEWAENVLFGYFPVTASKEPDDVKRNEKTAKAKGMGNGTRMLGANQCAMYDAKNRVGLPNEFELPNTYDDLLPILLGENVPVNVRRAVVRENPNARGWADVQRDANAEQARAEARSNAVEMARIPNPPREEQRDPTDTGRMQSSAQHEERERQASAERQLAQHQTAQREQVRREDVAARSNGTNGAPKGAPPMDPAQLKRMTDALMYAGDKKGQVYVGHVKDWCKQAESDPKKIEAILKRVSADCGMNF